MSAKGQEAVLYSFCAQANCTDGALPGIPLLLDPAGNLWGTTGGGGALSGGTVFKLDPASAESVFFSFNPSGTDGYGADGLTEDAKGNFYDATVDGGIGENGVVFKLSAVAQETVIHRFRGYPEDGSKPVAGLIRDSAGNLYGTTSWGGPRNCGTVFKIAP